MPLFLRWFFLRSWFCVLRSGALLFLCACGFFPSFPASFASKVSLSDWVAWRTSQFSFHLLLRLLLRWFIGPLSAVAWLPSLFRSLGFFASELFLSFFRLCVAFGFSLPSPSSFSVAPCSSLLEGCPWLRLFSVSSRSLILVSFVAFFWPVLPVSYRGFLSSYCCSCGFYGSLLYLLMVMLCDGRFVYVFRLF